jgi:hypothetical protein
MQNKNVVRNVRAANNLKQNAKEKHVYGVPELPTT